ncbi:hypothetical protein FQ186_04205 [Pseudomonas sp. ANT_H14]|nr:hypothetical protein FQ182_09720 [Pseudomonas sp. ANT_H4]KAA0953756.1 hypothetical protein FQ186_04205 [Pseudomonas sp. ANT_H14]
MVWPSGGKAAHLTRIWSAPVGLHNFDMQSSGGIVTRCPITRPAGDVMSFPAYLRSQSEQVARGSRLMIEVSALH